MLARRLSLWAARGNSNMLSFAERELEAIGEDVDVRDHMLEMVAVFANEGHSGASAAITADRLNRLLRFKPLIPLTGADDEWIEVGELDDSHGITYQNKRQSSVFKDVSPDGDFRVYYIDGFIFREPDGCCFTSYHSRRDITFPCLPSSVYIDVPKEATPEQQHSAVKKWQLENADA